MTGSAGGEPAPGAGFADVLRSRRMCRDFNPDPVPAEVVDRVVSAGFRGPSAGNTLGLDALVLVDGQVGDYWEVTLPSQRRSDFPWPGLLRAPVLVVPYVDPSAYVERYGRPDKASSGLGESTTSWPVPYWWVDGGAAVMAMLLAAEAEGLGALFFGQFHHEPAVSEHFGVPAPWRAVGTVAVGWSAPKGRVPSRSARHGRPNPEARVHPGRW